MRKIQIELASGSVAGLDNAVTAGATVLAVPGYTGSKEDFMPLLRPLGAAGFHVVSVDQRGQYESAWAADPSGYSLDALAADVCEIATTLDADRLHLVGHSFGGLVARAAVLAKPDLFASLTLMGSGPGPISGPRRAALEAGAPILAEHGMAALWQAMRSVTQANPRYVAPAPALLEFLRTRFLATDPVSLREMGDVLREVDDSTAELAATGVPLLVLHGVDDDAWRPSVQADMARRLGATYVVVDGAAHSPAVENPGVTASALADFWQSLAG